MMFSVFAEAFAQVCKSEYLNSLGSYSRGTCVKGIHLKLKNYLLFEDAINSENQIA